MQRFIREHMQGILAPFGEHVSELDSKVQALQLQLNRVSTKADRHQQRLSEHDDEIGTLQHELSDLTPAMAGCKSELERMAQDIGALQVSKTAQQEKLDKCDDRVDSTRDSVQALRESLEDSDASLHKLQLKQWETTNIVERVSNVMEQVQVTNATLDAKMFSLAKGHQTTSDQLRQDIENVCEALKRQKKESSEVLSGLDQWIKDLRQSIQQNSDKLNDQAEAMREQGRIMEEHFQEQGQEHKEAMEKLAKTTRRPSVAAGGEPLSPMSPTSPDGGRRASQAQQEIVSLGARLNTAEDTLHQLQSDLARQISAGLPSRVDDLDKQVRKALDATEKHAESIGRTEEALKADKDRLMRVDQEVQGVTLKANHLDERAVLVEGKVDELVRSERDHRRKLEQHKDEMESLGERQQELRSSAKKIVAAVQDVQGDVDQIKDKVGEHAAALELAHEYIQGVGRGFQDTHRQVLSGGNGMLPPASAREPRMLPSLPTRPVSAGTASRKVRVPHD